MPSHLATGPTRPVGRMCRSNGPITVGPVTTRMAPSKRASEPGMPKISFAATAVSPHVTKTPTVSSPASDLQVFRSSRKRRLKPPSNRISPTDRDTTGNSSGPKT
jgi:hypothetical protein